MRKNWDVLFLNLFSNKYFDTKRLKTEAVGGTQASIIRVAEGLGSLGLKVAVAQTNCAPFNEKKGDHCYYIHADHITSDFSVQHYVQIRNILYSSLFPMAKKYVWMHDYGTPPLRTWQSTLLKNDIKMIAVSKWHKKNLKTFLPHYDNITHVYNPVPDQAYLPKNKQSTYDNNLIVWMSSPHKGLKKALKLYKKIHHLRPSIRFLVFDPGYSPYHKDFDREKGVSFQGAAPCSTLWKEVRKALCVFYPCQYDETFCCIAAEANALGTPLATYRRGALPEVVSSRNQLVVDGDEEAIIKKVLNWHDHGRPVVEGKGEFRLENVVGEWTSIFEMQNCRRK